MSSLSLNARQEERIKQLARKAEVMKRKFEALRTAFNKHEWDRFIIDIKDYFGDIKKEHTIFRQNQSELDDSETMQKYIEYIRNINMYIWQTVRSGELNSQGLSGARETSETRRDQTAKHLKGLFDIPPLQRTSYVDLRSYAIKIETHYNALQVLEQPIADTILLYLFTSKLDRETRLKWEEMTENTPFPTVAELLTFLKERCDILKSKESTRHTRVHPYITSQVPVSCAICREPIGILRYSTLMPRTARERFIAVNEASASINVVRHHAAGFCRTCGRHHSLHRSLNQ